MNVKGKTSLYLQQPVGSETQLVPQAQNHKSRIQKVSLEQLKNSSQCRNEYQTLANGSKKKFTILFTSDTHSHIEPTIASFVSEKALGGVVRRIQYLEHVRKTSDQAVLVLDAGDFLQGTPYFEQFEGKAEIKFMNLAGYDIITVGNHDFDKGWPHLQSLIKKGKFDAVCSNIYPEESSETCLPPYSLLKIDNQHIAVVGIMGKDSWLSISSERRNGLKLKDPYEALNEVLPQIRSYVDVVILLSHCGIKEDRELAKHPFVDIIIGGHSHTWMTEQEIVKSTVGTDEKITPVFHAFRYGMLVGEMDVEFTEGKFSKTYSSVQYLDETFEPDYASASDTTKVAMNLFSQYQQKMEIYKNSLGECFETLSAKDKTFGRIEIGTLITDVFRKCGHASIGVIPAGAIRCGIEKGSFNLELLHKILPHAESLWVVSVKGSLIESLMKEGEERWGKARCFQYAGISLTKQDSEVIDLFIGDEKLDKNAFYKIAGPSFFFEREFMDKNKKILPQFKEEIQSVEEKFQDLRIPFAETIKKEGLGKWIKGVEQI